VRFSQIRGNCRARLKVFSLGIDGIVLIYRCKSINCALKREATATMAHIHDKHYNNISVYTYNKNIQLDCTFKENANYFFLDNEKVFDFYQWKGSK